MKKHIEEVSGVAWTHGVNARWLASVRAAWELRAVPHHVRQVRVEQFFEYLPPGNTNTRSSFCGNGTGEHSSFNKEQKRWRYTVTEVTATRETSFSPAPLANTATEEPTDRTQASAGRGTPSTYEGPQHTTVGDPPFSDGRYAFPGRLSHNNLTVFFIRIPISGMFWVSERPYSIQKQHYAVSSSDIPLFYLRTDVNTIFI